MFMRTLLTIFCLGWFIIASHADDQPRQKAIDPDTITAYQDFGALYGGFRGNAFSPGV